MAVKTWDLRRRLKVAVDLRNSGRLPNKGFSDSEMLASLIRT